ncbi:MAG: AMP-binding protein, partial [Acidimicrobiales bacterium]
MSDDQDRGEVLWTPPPDAMRTTRLGRFVRWLQPRGRTFDDYESLWRWSVSDLDGFWSELREFADVGTAPGPALASATMPGAEWFPGSTWNYAQEALRHEVVGPSGPLGGEPAPAVVAWSQTRGPVELSMEELRDQVARCRAGLVRLGVRPGDRVAAYLPNIPEAVVAMLAVASIGAVWTSAPPEFGVRAVIDRFGQVEPVVLIAVEGYQYGGRRIDRRDHLDQLRRDLPSLRHTVVVSYSERTSTGPDVVGWDDLLVEAAERLEHEPVPFSHPLYVLYSSGTTGKPKAIVHGHGGIICEHVKALALHHDLGPGDRFFWYSTTGWMMWN